MQTETNNGGVVLAIAGRIASGKSTVSERIAREWSWSRASFGDYVREVAESRGLDHSRRTLQEIGVELIGQGWESFCKAVLEHGNWEPGTSVVVDGIRHLEAVETIRRLVAPAPVFLLFLAVGEETRLLRLRRRSPEMSDEPCDPESHPTEVQVTSGLSSAAELVLDGEKSLDELVQKIVTFLAARGHRPPTHS